jgi:hypothetical protein
VRGAAEEYLSGFLETTNGNAAPELVATGYSNEYAKVSSFKFVNPSSAAITACSDEDTMAIPSSSKDTPRRVTGIASPDSIVLLEYTLTACLLFDRSTAFLLHGNRGWAVGLTPTLPVLQHRADMPVD